MPLTRFKLSAIEDGGIATADLADGAVTTDKLADSAVTIAKTDSLLENPTMTGTEAAKMPVGTTAQRANATSGDIRFNSTISLMEYYDGTIWKAIDSPPVVSSISPTTESDASADITITGSNFQSGATVKFVGDDGTEYSSPSVTFNSSTEIVATTPATALTVANEPYDIVVSNPSGLSGTGADLLDAGGLPTFDTASGSIGTILDSTRSSYTLSAVTATDPDNDAITYALGSGDSLPAGLSLNSSTGAITGTATAVGSDTTTTFDIEATSQGETSTREFSITVNAPVITSYTSTGSGTFSVPSGVTAVDVLVVAGGGGGGRAGGGGAGGLIYRPSFPVTPGGTVSYTVGGGGGGASADNDSGKSNGQNSVFGSLTAQGGGFGGHSYPSGGTSSGNSGGSGGGGGFNDPGQNAGGSGTQPQQPGDSGPYGFGNPGGPGGSNPFNSGGGGGGAGAAGSGGPTGPNPGGIGKQYGISGSQVYYAGGGGASSHQPGPSGRSAGGQGGGGEGSAPGELRPESTGAANRGGGGGASHYNPAGAHSELNGGSGIVIVSY